MPGRRVLVEIVKGTDADGRGAEGIRAVIGLRRAFVSHTVQMLLCDDGVEWVKRERAWPADVKPLLAHLRILDISRVVDADSLAARGLAAEDLVAGVEILSRTQVEAVREGAEARLVY